VYGADVKHDVGLQIRSAAHARHPTASQPTVTVD